MAFQRFTGLEVAGNLVCEGTETAPVVYTSVNDLCPEGVEIESDDPAPFDWNGVTFFF